MADVHPAELRGKIRLADYEMRQRFLDQHSGELSGENARVQDDPIRLLAVHEAADLIRRRGLIHMLQGQRVALLV